MQNSCEQTLNNALERPRNEQSRILKIESEHAAAKPSDFVFKDDPEMNATKSHYLRPFQYNFLDTQTIQHYCHGAYIVLIFVREYVQNMFCFTIKPKIGTTTTQRLHSASR